MCSEGEIEKTRALHWIHTGIRLCSNSALPVFLSIFEWASLVDAAASRFEEPPARRDVEIPYRRAFQGRRCHNNRWQNVRTLVYRPAGGAGFCAGRRLRLGGKRRNQRSASDLSRLNSVVDLPKGPLELGSLARSTTSSFHVVLTSVGITA
jgi:hypothetical protein